MIYKYQKEHSFEERKANSENLLKQFSDRVPIICEKDPKWKGDGSDRTKFLVQNTTTVTQLKSMLQRKIKMDTKEAMFVLIGGKHQVSGEKTLGEIYDNYKDEDGFLYLSYAGQLSWGFN